jgi:hypothetical protein
MADISEMRAALKTKYSSYAWRVKVTNMTDAQVRAHYSRSMIHADKQIRRLKKGDR